MTTLITIMLISKNDNCNDNNWYYRLVKYEIDDYLLK